MPLRSRCRGRRRSAPAHRARAHLFQHRRHPPRYCSPSPPRPAPSCRHGAANTRSRATARRECRAPRNTSSRPRPPCDRCTKIQSSRRCGGRRSTLKPNRQHQFRTVVEAGTPSGRYARQQAQHPTTPRQPTPACRYNACSVASPPRNSDGWQPASAPASQAAPRRRCPRFERCRPLPSPTRDPRPTRPALSSRHGCAPSRESAPAPRAGASGAPAPSPSSRRGLCAQPQQP
jgi:hypothetical protein